MLGCGVSGLCLVFVLKWFVHSTCGSVLKGSSLQSGVGRVGTYDVVVLSWQHCGSLVKWRTRVVVGTFNPRVYV